MGGRGAVDEKSMPLVSAVDELTCQIPHIPPTGPVRGVLGHYIDRCITREEGISLSLSLSLSLVKGLAGETNLPW